jgi:hypothetical protein
MENYTMLDEINERVLCDYSSQSGEDRKSIDPFTIMLIISAISSLIKALQKCKEERTPKQICTTRKGMDRLRLRKILRNLAKDDENITFEKRKLVEKAILDQGQQLDDREYYQAVEEIAKSGGFA